MWRAYNKYRSYINLMCVAVLLASSDLYWHSISTINKTIIRSLYFTTECGHVTNIDVCGVSTTLSVDAGDVNYTWSTGETTPSITVTSSGLYSWETVDLANNQVANGYFTNDNAGFTSAYTYEPVTASTGAAGALTAEGTYSVTTNPRLAHTYFSIFPDHTANTTGPRNMMVVNGASTANVVVWKEAINVQPNTDYIFSVWATTANLPSPGILNFSINGVSLGSPILLSSIIPDWRNFKVRWSSAANTTAQIAIVNQNTAVSGNDFALDDIIFAPVCKKAYNVTFHPYPLKPAITSQ